MAPNLASSSVDPIKETEVTLATSVATRFMEEIRRLKLSQVALAAKAGVSAVAVSNYARGIRLPTIEVLIKIDELGGDIRYILTGKQLPQLASRHIDIQRFGIAFDEAQRQAIDNGEELSQKALFDRAWVIFQAFGAMLNDRASSDSRLTAGKD